MLEEVSKEGVSEITPTSESDKERLYGDILHKEASSLLAKYLPVALPQEPTEILFDLSPVYLGKFIGKYYITVEDVSVYEFDIKTTKLLEEMKESTRRWEERDKEFFRLLESGEFDGKEYDEIEKILAQRKNHNQK